MAENTNANASADANDKAGASKGLLDSLGTLASTLLGMAQTRLDLLALDLEEDRAHLMSLLVLAMVAMFCLGIATVLATVLLIAACWDEHRLLALGVLAGFYLVAGLGAWARAQHKLKMKPSLFSASLAELKSDREHLGATR